MQPQGLHTYSHGVAVPPKLHSVASMPSTQPLPALPDLILVFLGGGEGEGPGVGAGPGLDTYVHFLQL